MKKYIILMLGLVCALGACEDTKKTAERDVVTDPTLIWQPVSNNRMTQALTAYDAYPTLSYKLVTEPVLINTYDLTASFVDVQADCPEMLVTEPVDTAITTDYYLAYENVEPLPAYSFGSTAFTTLDTTTSASYLGLKQSALTPEESKYKYLLVVEPTIDTTKVKASVYLTVKDKNFSHEWIKDKDEYSGTAVEGLHTSAFVHLPAGPTLDFVKTSTTAVDPCAY